MLKHLIHDNINEIFLKMQDREGITDGGIDPFDALYLEELEQQLEQVIQKVLNYQKRGKCVMKAGDLIAVNGVLYDYVGFDEETRSYKVAIVEIDEEGLLTNTHNTWYLTAAELSNRGIDLTQKQWLGLTEHFLRQEYDLTEEEITEAAEDIVCRCFTVTRIPLVEELPNYIAIYMNR